MTARRTTFDINALLPDVTDKDDACVARLEALIGDNRGVGEAIGKEIGVDEVKADPLPEDKVTSIKEMLASHGRIAMVGDGVNDVPARANATVSIAMVGAGTAVVLETAAHTDY